MGFIVTIMVRDEVDIIAAFVEHHLAQGADLIIATDNGSVDGTTEVLQEYADLGLVELHHDPVHRKQQRDLVTKMARRAFTEHGARWVVNADADEFFVPVDRSLTLAQAFDRIPTSLGAFTAPVFNLVGIPAQRGGGVDRLLWRDHRTEEALQAVGIHAQPTANAVHIGSADVTVQQGNHVVSIPSTGQPDPAVAIECYHLPWRSYEQLERKTVNTGRSYEASPDLRPSPRHHGMADYRRWQGGRLRYTFLARMPLAADLEVGERDATFLRDDWLRDHLHALVGTAVLPSRLEACLDTAKDEDVDPQEHRQALAVAKIIFALEQERDEFRRLADENHRKAARIAKERDAARAALTPRGLAAALLARPRRYVAAAARRLRRLRRHPHPHP